MPRPTRTPEPARPAPGTRWIELRGRDYPLLGPLGCVQLPDGGAVALGRGAYPKAYKHLDPNEDGALVYRAEFGSLLCVVDGHNGVAASELALDLALAQAGSLLAADDRGFVEAVLSLVHDLSQALGRERRSRTCLLLARVGAEHCHWAGFGDCGLFRSSRLGAENRVNQLFLGAKLPSGVHSPEHWSGRFGLVSGERIALVSDGITNFVRDSALIRTRLAGAADDAGAAVGLAQAAMHAGAGDNVAVAALAPYPA